MRFGSASLLTAVWVGWPVPMAAQQVTELGVHALAATSTAVLVAGGLYAAVRPSQRVRMALTAAAGVADGGPAVRGELLGHFLLDPAGIRGASAYAGAGVAGAAGPVEEGYLVLLLGLESRPGAASGWALEVGVGGGLRIAAGYRWRRHPRG